MRAPPTDGLLYLTWIERGGDSAPSPSGTCTPSPEGVRARGGGNSPAEGNAVGLPRLKDVRVDELASKDEAAHQIAAASVGRLHIDIESRATPNRDHLAVTAIGHDHAEVDRVSGHSVTGGRF